MCTSIQWTNVTYSCIFMITYRTSVCAYVHTNICTLFIRVHFVCQLLVWQYATNHGTYCMTLYALYNPTQNLCQYLVVVQWIRCIYMFWIAQVSDPVGEIFWIVQPSQLSPIFLLKCDLIQTSHPMITDWLCNGSLFMYRKISCIFRGMEKPSIHCF